MNQAFSINRSFCSFASTAVASNILKANPLITFATMNRVELVIHTKESQEKYRIEERDAIFFIEKYERSFLGFSRYKKLAQARSKENALKIIHILTKEEILHLEVTPIDYFGQEIF